MDTMTPPIEQDVPTWAPPSPDQDPPKRAKAPMLGMKVLATFAVIALAVAAFAMSSLALFTDTAVSDPNAFATGTVDIDTDSPGGAYAVSNMAPGDEEVREIVVSNNGSLDLRYALTSLTTENTLAAQLDFTIRAGVADCSVANWDASGNVAAATGVLGSTPTATATFGSVASGQQAGDRVLAAGASETLCFHVLLPLSSDNSFQNLSTSATFDFVAEQTRNNP